MGQYRELWGRFGPPFALGLAFCLLLVGCDQNSPSAGPNSPASQPAAAAPDPEGPPTDDEILSALLGFWRDRHGSPLVTPIGARQANNAMTQDVMGTKVRTVTVAYTFRANANLTYMCEGIVGQVLGVSPAPNLPMNTLPNAASAGSTFSCRMTVEADRVEEGWNVSPVDGDPIGYLFKR